MKQYLLILGLFIGLFTSSVQAQNLSGREFWFAFPQVNSLAAAEGPAFFIISDYCIDSGLVEIPLLNYKAYFNIVPGQYTQINLPPTINGLPYYHNLANKVEQKGVRISTPFPAAVYAVTYSQASVDGETVLPTEFLGTEYVAAMRAEVLQGLIRTTIIGTENNTNVTIKHWHPTTGAPITTKTTLNRGETYQFTSTRTTIAAELQVTSTANPVATVDGAVIKGDKPIAIVNSVNCGNTNDCGPCDNMMTMPLPTEKWAKNYTLAQVIPRNPPGVAGTCAAKSSGDWFQIMGPVGTPVKIITRTGTRVDTIKYPAWHNNANYGYGYIWGENLPASTLTAAGDCDMVIESETNNIQVLQYQKSYSADNLATTDPEALYVYPTTMWESSYLIGSLRVATSTTGYLTVVVNDVGTPSPIGTILQNGANIGAGGWITIGTSTWKYKRITNVPANATIRYESNSGAKFAVYSATQGPAESFSFQGGVGPVLKSVCPTCPIAELTGKKAFCIGESIQFTDLSRDNDKSGTSQIVKWEWIWGDGTTDTYTTKTNPTHTYTTPGNYKVILRVTNNSIPICTQDFEYRIFVSDGPTINLGPDVSICKGGSIQLGGNPTVSGGLAPYVISWSPAGSLSSAVATNPTAKPTATTQYEITVTDSAKCQLKKTVNVKVNPIDSAYLSIAGTICAGASYDLKINITPYDPTLSYNLVYFDGTSNKSLANVKNGDLISVTPSATTDYKLIDFESTTKCTVFSPAIVKVTVRPLPTADFNNAANPTICANSSLGLLINLTGGAPYNYTITNNAGLTSIIKSNYNGAIPATENVLLNQNTSFTISNVEYTTLPKCSVNPNKTLSVTIKARPNPSTNRDTTICEKNSLTLSQLTKQPVDAGGFWTDSSNAGGLSNGVYQPVLQKPGTYVFKYNLTGNNICPDTFSVAKVKVVDAPRFDNINYNCDADGKNYNANSVVSGGDPSSYIATGGVVAFQTTKYIFNTSSLPNKSQATITIDDANKCGPTSETIRFNCACRTKAGTMASSPLELCETATALATFKNDSVTVPGDSIIFILHEGSSTFLVKELARSATPSFSFIAAKMQYGKTYYISPVAGVKSPDGVDTNLVSNECLSVGAGQAVTFFKQVDAQLGSNIDICLNTTGSLNITQLSGQSPYSVKLNEVGTSNNILFTNLNGSSTLAVNPSATTQYQLIEVSDKYCINSNPTSTTVTVSVHDVPNADDLSKNILCNNDATKYTYSFNIVNGDAPSYKITPSTVGSINGNTFTSNLISSGTRIQFTISDKFNCGVTTIDTTFKCNCITQPGSLSPNTVIKVCDTQVASFATVSGANLDSDDITEYILSSSKIAPLTTILARSSTPSFSYLASYTYGVSYWAFAITGNNNAGSVDVGDPCIGITNPVEIIFNSLPDATIGADQTICANQTTNLVVNFSNKNMAPQMPYTLEYTANGVAQAIPPAFTNPSGSIPISPTVNTVYQLTRVTDKNGCFANITSKNLISKVDVSPAPSAILSIAKNAICLGDEVAVLVQLTGKKPFNYTLNYGTTNINKPNFNQNIDTVKFTPTSNTNFQITSLSDGCPGQNSNTVSVIVNPLPTITANSPAQSCFGTPVQASFIFDNPTDAFDVSYTENGNNKSVSAVKSNQKIPFNVALGLNTLKAISVKNLTTGCINTAVSAISTTDVTPLPVGNFTNLTGAICEGADYKAKLNLVGNAPFSFDLLKENQFITSYNQVGGGESELTLITPTKGVNQYTLTKLSDKFGCKNTFNDILRLDVFEAPIVKFRVQNNTGCKPVSAILTNESVIPGGSGTCTWTFSDGSKKEDCGSFSKIFQYAGEYDVELRVTSDLGCTAKMTQPKLVKVYDYPRVDFVFENDNPTVIEPQVTMLNRTIGANKYLWTVSDVGTYTSVNPVVTFPDTAERAYKVKLVATNEANCADSTTKEIFVDGVIIAYVPNSFSPNNDGKNDLFKPVVTGQRREIRFYEFSVFNRWGELLYTTKELDEGWDGLFKGVRVKSDNFIYSVKVKSIYDADTKQYTGSFKVLY